MTARKLKNAFVNGFQAFEIDTFKIGMKQHAVGSIFKSWNSLIQNICDRFGTIVVLLQPLPFIDRRSV